MRCCFLPPAVFDELSLDASPLPLTAASSSVGRYADADEWQIDGDTDSGTDRLLLLRSSLLARSRRCSSGSVEDEDDDEEDEDEDEDEADDEMDDDFDIWRLQRSSAAAGRR